MGEEVKLVEFHNGWEEVDDFDDERWDKMVWELNMNNKILKKVHKILRNWYVTKILEKTCQ